MSLFTRAWFFLSPDEPVASALKKWQPEDCRKEKDYEKSLLAFLRTKLSGIEVMAQYGSGRQRVDVVVGKKVAIELKNNLTTTAAFQRAKGQLDDLCKDFAHVFLVLVGKSDAHLYDELTRYAKETNDKLWAVEQDRLAVINKSASG